MTAADFDTFHGNSIESLLSQRHPQGHWEGQLSTSALSTATAIVALHQVDAGKHREMIARGGQWLLENQNADGGWGDTTQSQSNISTTLLVWSAVQLCCGEERHEVYEASNWIRDYVGSLDPDRLSEVVQARYGKDRTFSVPILMFCAICGTLGERGWRHVLPLPYELAACPRQWFAAMKLPVVSYALPALISIGRARYYQRAPWLVSPSRWVRKLAWPKVSALLQQIQPESGGYLEAAPLTSFVIMALANANEKAHPAVKLGVQFLQDTVRPDGSWPIDTNLATWATTLAVKALGEESAEAYDQEAQGVVKRFLLDQQYRHVHPFTNSPPGGWAWTDLSGGVPDADDTPGAMLALHLLADNPPEQACIEAAERGAVWLLDLQNGDGGMPTFCKGWGALPFDRSSPDLTAHALRAWEIWEPRFDSELQSRIETGRELALQYLWKTQQLDGSWIPLWFGNQYRTRDEANPTYGTAMVCRALESMAESDNQVADRMAAGHAWLMVAQNPDGGWGAGSGTPSSIEETALAVSALANHANVERGIEWLAAETRLGTSFPASPIGFYFARLWYYERIYPFVWTVEALNIFKACQFRT